MQSNENRKRSSDRIARGGGGGAGSNRVGELDFANDIAAATGRNAPPSQWQQAHSDARRQGREADAALRRLQQRSATATVDAGLAAHNPRSPRGSAHHGTVSRSSSTGPRGGAVQATAAAAPAAAERKPGSHGEAAAAGAAGSLSGGNNFVIATPEDVLPPAPSATTSQQVGIGGDAPATSSRIEVSLDDHELAEIGGMHRLTRAVDWTRTDINIFERTSVLPRFVQRFLPRSVTHCSLLAVQFRYRAIEDEFLRFEYRTQRCMLALVTVIALLSNIFVLATQSSNTGLLVMAVLTLITAFVSLCIELGVVITASPTRSRISDALSLARTAETNQVFFYGVASALLSFGAYLHMESCPKALENHNLVSDPIHREQFCYAVIEARPMTAITVATINGRPRLRYFIPMLIVDFVLVFFGRLLKPVDSYDDMGAKIAGLFIGFAISFVVHRQRECEKRRYFVEFAIFQSRAELATARGKSLRDFVDNMLPPVMRNRLLGFKTLLDVSENSSCVVVDVANFSQFTFSFLPQEAATSIATLAAFCAEQATVAGIDRVRSVGDRFVAVGNLMSAAEDHASRCARFGLLLYTAIAYSPMFAGRGLGLRCAIHSGQLLGGVVGETHIRYDLYGAAYVVATSIIVSCPPNMIICTKETNVLFAVSRDIVSESAKAMAPNGAIVSVVLGCATTKSQHEIFYVLGMNAAAVPPPALQAVQPSATQPMTDDDTSIFSGPDEEHLVEVGSHFVASTTDEARMAAVARAGASFAGGDLSVVSGERSVQGDRADRVVDGTASPFSRPVDAQRYSPVEAATNEPTPAVQLSDDEHAEMVQRPLPPQQLAAPVDTLSGTVNPMKGPHAAIVPVVNAFNDGERQHSLTPPAGQSVTGVSVSNTHVAVAFENGAGGTQAQSAQPSAHASMQHNDDSSPSVPLSRETAQVPFSDEELTLLTARRMVSQMVVEDYSTATSLQRQKRAMELEGPLRFRSHHQEAAFLRHRRDADLVYVVVHCLAHAISALFFIVLATAAAADRGTVDAAMIIAFILLGIISASAAAAAYITYRENEFRRFQRRKIVEWELAAGGGEGATSGAAHGPNGSVGLSSELRMASGDRDHLEAIVDSAQVHGRLRWATSITLVAYHLNPLLLPLAAALTHPSILTNNIKWIYFINILSTFTVLPFRQATVYFLAMCAWTFGSAFLNGGMLQPWEMFNLPLIAAAAIFKEHQREAAQRLNFHDIGLTRQAIETLGHEEKVRACVLQGMIPPPVQKRAAVNRFSGQFITWALSDLVVMNIHFDQLESALFDATRESSAEAIVQLIQDSTGQAEATIRSICKILAIVSLFGDNFLLAGPLIDGNEVDVQASACEAAVLIDALCDPDGEASGGKPRRTNSWQQATSSRDSINSYGSSIRERLGPDGSFSSSTVNLRPSTHVVSSDAGGAHPMAGIPDRLSAHHAHPSNNSSTLSNATRVFTDLNGTPLERTHSQQGTPSGPAPTTQAPGSVSPLLNDGLMASAQFSVAKATRTFTVVAAIGHATCVLTSNDYPTFDVFGIALSMVRSMAIACPLVGGTFATEKLVQMATRDLAQLPQRSTQSAGSDTSSDSPGAAAGAANTTGGANPSSRVEYLHDLTNEMRRRRIQFGAAETWSIRGYGQLRVCSVIPALLQRSRGAAKGAAADSSSVTSTVDVPSLSVTGGGGPPPATPLKYMAPAGSTPNSSANAAPTVVATGAPLPGTQHRQQQQQQQQRSDLPEEDELSNCDRGR